jgi:hypothetical protein
MKKSFLAALIAVSAFTMSSHAQGISGKWKTSLEGPQGSMELSFTYKVDGAKLSGTTNSPMGSQEIKNGKVTENEFYYEIDMMGNVAKFNGKLDKDIIKLTVKMPEGGPEGGPGELKLTRVN